LGTVGKPISASSELERTAIMNNTQTRDYIVILELRNPNARNENYRPLFSELENIGRCLTQFVWVVKSGLPAGDLCRSLGAST